MMDPPGWYKTFCYMELTLQLPFFFIATFAFMLGEILIYYETSYSAISNA